MHAPKVRDGETPRAKTAARGYDERHRVWRRDVLRRDPICRECKAALSTIADHIKAIRDGGARFDPENGQGLCHPCHNRKTSRERTARRREAGAGQISGRKGVMTGGLEKRAQARNGLEKLKRK